MKKNASHINFDCIVIGGGIVGLSTAWQLQARYPKKKILLLEKEAELSCHQTGRNSGVIHSGIYYDPGSFKAEFCKRGLSETLRLCKEHNIPHEQCGKLLVATNQLELVRMSTLYKRGNENQVYCSLLSANELKQLEPNINGLGAIFVPSTGIVDYRQVSLMMAREFIKAGGSIKLNNHVCGIEENDMGVTVVANGGKWQSSFLVCCGGLQSDRLARLHGLNINFKIIPFRGEYYRLPDHMSGLIKNLIYPIPDPDVPFLGVHLTRMIDGTITIGPNALLGWKREGYGRLNFNIRDSKDMLWFKGFWKIITSNFQDGIQELKKSLIKKAFLEQINKYCPQIAKEDLLPFPVGVRAQAVLSDGTFVHDFLFAESLRSLHVCNAPSPAATSAIPIGEYLCEKLKEKIG